MQTVADIIKKGSWMNAPAPPAIEGRDLADPACPVCQGQGLLRVEVPVGHPLYGKLTPCDCAKMDGTTYHKKTGLTDQERNTLQWADIKNTDNIAEAVQAIQGTFRQGYGFVYLWGPWGTGKTLILQTAVATMLRRGAASAYTRMIDILDDLKEGFGEGDESMRMEFWNDSNVLAIDEFEKIQGSEWGTIRRFALLDSRYMAACRGQSITLIASNVSPDQLPGEIRDRILDGRFRVVEMSGTSKRPAMTYEGLK